MADKTLSIQQKKEWAKLLYTKEGVTVQKEIAQRTGVSEKTISKWIKDENWERLRASVILTKEEELRRLYMQFTELNDVIMKREEGTRFASSKEADILVKLSSAIRSLETDLSISDAIHSYKSLINFVRPENLEEAKIITRWSDIYIKSLLK